MSKSQGREGGREHNTGGLGALPMERLAHFTIFAPPQTPSPHGISRCCTGGGRNWAGEEGGGGLHAVPVDSGCQQSVRKAPQRTRHSLRTPGPRGGGGGTG